MRAKSVDVKSPAKSPAKSPNKTYEFNVTEDYEDKKYSKSSATTRTIPKLPLVKSVSSEKETKLIVNIPKETSIVIKQPIFEKVLTKPIEAQPKNVEQITEEQEGKVLRSFISQLIIHLFSFSVDDEKLMEKDRIVESPVFEDEQANLPESPAIENIDEIDTETPIRTLNKKSNDKVKVEMKSDSTLDRLLMN